MQNSSEPFLAEIDTAFQKLQASLPDLSQYQGQDLSESDTRSKVIDPILSILGWEEPSIRREWHEREEGKFLDYKLATTQPVFVVEAKKQFVKLEIPDGGARFYRVSGAIRQSKNLSQAIDQARLYAYNSGMLFCCVTNGFQFIFFRSTNGVGVTWGNQLVVVFRDHHDILSRFSEFWNIFSYESVSAGRFASFVPVNHVPGNEGTRFQRFAAELKVDYETRDRNALFPYTRELIRRIFQSLDNDDVSTELLEHCYVESARDSSYERGIGELLKEHRTKLPDGAVKLVTSKRNAGDFQSHVETLAESSSAGSVTLLLGTLGAGKTTFINRFRKVFARQLIDEHFVWIQLSFNLFVESHDKLATWVSEHIGSSLKTNYSEFNPFTWESLQQVYASEIKELRDGVLNPLFRHDKIQYELKIAEEVRQLAETSESHVLRCLQYYAQRTGRKVILVFDNADQHSVALQNETFLLAQKYSQTLNCLAFISLREESFWKNKEFGGLSAFHATSFQISAPRIEQVLAKRFKYASTVILEDTQIQAGAYASSALDLDATQINNVFRTLQNTLLGEDKRFVRFLEYLSPGEVRRALEFVARFLTSGHTNVNRIMDRSRNGIAVPVPFYEFLQAVMLGDRRHYREDLSDIVNLFAVDGKGDRSHFNRIGVISRVLSAVGEVSDRGKGFVPVSEVIIDCESIGMSAETAASIIGLLVEKRILATDTLIRDDFTSNASIRATSAAVYYINELSTDFTYIDNVIIDTEIGNDGVRGSLSDLSRRIFTEADRFSRLELRIERTRRFLSYLRDEYDSSKLSQAGSKFDISGKGLIKRAVDDFPGQGDRIIANARIAFNRPRNDLFGATSSSN